MQILFQDEALSTPVTTSGQRVGAMIDLSGNGFTAWQVDNARLIYRTDGTYHWLEGDGVGTFMRTGIASNSVNFPFFMAGVFSSDNVGANDLGAYRFMTRREGEGTSSGTRGSISVNQSKVLVHTNGTTTFDTVNVANGQTINAIAQFNQSGTSAFVESQEFNSTNAITTSGPQDVIIMAQNDVPQRSFKGRYYGSIIAEGIANFESLNSYLNLLAPETDV